MNIKQFRYGADNLGYLLYADDIAIVIDGGAANALFSFVRENDLRIEFVLNTHDHPDHTAGSDKLAETSGAIYLDQEALLKKGYLILNTEIISIHHTPGHTKDSVVFHTGSSLITGDTLFNGTIGNCFSGDLSAFLRSVKLLLSFPKDTVIYAGHDYVSQAMTFAKWLEPNNADIEHFLKKYKPDPVCSTLEDELKVNPYLRFNAPEIIAVLKNKGLPDSTEWERWESLMSLE